MRPSIHILRGLRFRLALIYVLLFGALLVVIGVGFSAHLRNDMESQVRDALDQEWDTAKGYLRVEKHERIWTYDVHDPEDDLIQARLRNVVLLADPDGNILEEADVCKSLGLDSISEIHRVLALSEPDISIRYDPVTHEPFWVKAG